MSNIYVDDDGWKTTLSNLTVIYMTETLAKYEKMALKFMLQGDVSPVLKARITALAKELTKRTSEDSPNKKEN